MGDFMNFPQSTFNAGTLTNIDQQLKDLIINDAEIKQAILNNPDAVKRILQSTIIDEIKQDIKTQKLLLSFNYENEKQTFLDHYKSEHTRNGYKYALQDFENFCNLHQLKTPLECNPATADEWIYNQRKENKAPATIRRNVAGVSAFFTYIERASNHKILNPLRGTKARPKEERKTQNKFYSMGNVDALHLSKVEQDIRTIINAVDNPELKVIILIMYKRGLRCGSFERMNIHGEQFKTVSKEKTITGVLDAELLQALNDAGIKHNAPFTEWNENRLKCLFRYYSTKLYKAGLINYVYSCHDLRHYYALNEYTKNKDIHRLSKLLNHSSIAITEKYLRGLYVDL